MTAPKLRFAGFMDSWECLAIRDIGTVITGSTPPRCDSSCWGGEFNWISSKDFKGKYIFDSDEKITDKGKKHCRLLSAGSVLVTCIGASIGLKAIAKNPCATNQQINAIICKACDNEYLYYLLGFLKDQLRRRAGQTALPIISKGVFESFEGKFPSVDEQTAISGVLSSFDSLIDAEALRLESLRKLKSACMAKMFAGVGETCPKMRFKGYSGEWIAKRLGDLVNRVDRKNVNMEALIPLTISAKDGLIAQEQFFDKRIASTNLCGYYLIRKGEFAYNRSSSQGYPFGSVKRLEKYDNGALSALYTVFGLHDMISSDFMKAYFDTDKWHGEVRFRACEGARNHGLLNISADDFFQLELRIPPTIEEQNAIGEFMINLDMSIRLQGNRVEKMRHLKWACMERMFV